MLRPYIDWYSSKDTADSAPRGTGYVPPRFLAKGAELLENRRIDFFLRESKKERARD